MGRPAKWNGKSQAIRVPEHCADELMQIAQMMDKARSNGVDSFVQKPDPLEGMMVSISDHEGQRDKVVVRTRSEWEKVGQICDEIMDDLYDYWESNGLTEDQIRHEKDWLGLQLAERLVSGNIKPSIPVREV
jgi:hypothetical protein